MSNICIRCHLPFASGGDSKGGWSEAIVMHGGVGPFHAECSRAELGEQSKIERLTAERDSLRAAFAQYANHKPDCSGGNGTRCACGYLDLWTAHQQQVTEAKDG